MLRMIWGGGRHTDYCSICCCSLLREPIKEHLLRMFAIIACKTAQAT